MDKPKLDKAEVFKLLSDNNIDTSLYPVCVVAIRGYYLDSMGIEDENDRGLYDDACFVVIEGKCHPFNFNTDPSKVREGHGTAEGTKGMAQLKTGVWMYRTGLHKGYEAFIQAEAVTVYRDGVGGKAYYDHGWFGINLHRGGSYGTGSEGCQTWPKEQFDEAKELIYTALDLYEQKVFPYFLVDEIERRSKL